MPKFSGSLKRRVIRFFVFFKYLNQDVIVEVFRRSARQRFPGLSAEIAYNAFFAIFPATLVVLTAIGLVEIPDHALIYLIRHLDGIIPDEATTLLQRLVLDISQNKSRSLFSLSFLTTLWVASSVFSALMAALDQIHQVPLERLRPFWQTKLRSLGLTFTTLALLVVALTNWFLSDAAIKILAHHTGYLAHSVLRFWHQLSLPIALMIVTVILRTLYRYGPSDRLSSIPTMSGAFIATVLWGMISWLFRLYIIHFGSYNQTYGAIGAVMVLLLWLDLSALITLVGSQLNVVVGEAMTRSRSAKSLHKGN